MSASPPWYRNPWIIAFLAGAATLTVLAPRLRYVPDAPPAMGQLDLVGFVDTDGVPVEDPFADRISVVGFVDLEAADVCRQRTVEQLGKLWMMFASEGDPTAVMTVALRPSDGTGKRWARARHAAPGLRAGWTWVGPREDAAGERVAEALTSSQSEWMALPEVSDCAGSLGTGFLTIVDGAGEFRGFYAIDRPNVTSEVLHRSRHVRDVSEPASEGDTR